MASPSLHLRCIYVTWSYSFLLFFIFLFFAKVPNRYIPTLKSTSKGSRLSEFIRSNRTLINTITVSCQILFFLLFFFFFCEHLFSFTQYFLELSIRFLLWAFFLLPSFFQRMLLTVTMLKHMPCHTSLVSQIATEHFSCKHFPMCLMKLFWYCSHASWLLQSFLCYKHKRNKLSTIFSNFPFVQMIIFLLYSVIALTLLFKKLTFPSFSFGRASRFIPEGYET